MSSSERSSGRPADNIMTNKLIRRGPLRRRIRKAFIQICLNLKTQHHCKSQKRYMTRSRQSKQFKQFFTYSLARSLREHPVFSSQVSSFTRRETPGETRNLSRKNRMLSQVTWPEIPDEKSYLRASTSHVI